MNKRSHGKCVADDLLQERKGQLLLSCFPPVNFISMQRPNLAPTFTSLGGTLERCA